MVECMANHCFVSAGALRLLYVLPRRGLSFAARTAIFDCFLPERRTGRGIGRNFCQSDRTVDLSRLLGTAGGFICLFWRHDLDGAAGQAIMGVPQRPLAAGGNPPLALLGCAVPDGSKLRRL